MVRFKTSIYIDRRLWKRFKEYAARRSMKVSKLLEELINNEIIDYMLNDFLLELAGSEGYELDFEPIEPKEGSISELIRVMRDERRNNISK